MASETTESSSEISVDTLDPNASSTLKANTTNNVLSDTSITPSVVDNPQIMASPKSITNSVWGTCPITFDDTTGVLTIMAGELG
ncbi:hypothetical protein ACI1UG_10565 [Lactococcus garvieae]|uniref:hypothetical protein n=1 Tax=Lactococcus garvieae TaxID=1363 RepID=UPI0038522176